MPLTHQAVQACHAAIASGRDLIKCEEPYLVLCAIPTKNELVALSVMLTKAGIAHRVFREEDMGGRPTALATEALTQEQRKHLRHLQLYCVAEREPVAV
jgi:hypothetical protein